ncbi:MAG: 3-hydroxyacyl-CoA dehydrogenase/enoyl-CoA hydratase family protein, partial [Balneolaceae bacterium]
QIGYSALMIMLYGMKKSGSVSSYDEILAEKIARILTGGDLSEPQTVPESYVLKLEREAILELIEDDRTLSRMEYILKTGKSLRN